MREHEISFADEGRNYLYTNEGDDIFLTWRGGVLFLCYERASSVVDESRDSSYTN